MHTRFARLSIHLLLAIGIMLGLAFIAEVPTSSAAEITNIARSARATASTVFSNDYRPERAIDGIWGYNQWVWASAGELNPWLRLSWSSTQVVTEVRIYDRPGTDENINSGVLTFSDGSSLVVRDIPQEGTSPKRVSFAPKAITWVKFQVTGGEGANLGVSEIEVYGRAEQSSPTTTTVATTATTVTPTSTPPIEHTSGATNYARSARATASTVFSNDYRPERAIDGIWGYNQWVWASAGELNPWLRLSWSSTQVVTEVRIYDRPGTDENINSGVLTFSDGSSLVVRDIPQEGTSPKRVSFAPKAITWVKFQVTGGEGANLGVSEFEIYGPARLRTNVAPLATTTTSSVFSNDYRPQRAIDGIWGYNQWVWASAGELNPWLQLDWSSTQVVTAVRIYDRPGTGENINSGVLTFSDGSSITVENIPQDGALPKELHFEAKDITWVKFQVTGGEGANLGVSEFEVYGTSSQTTPTTTATTTTVPTITPLPDELGCTISINSGAVHTNSPNVQLYLQVPEATQMQISNDGGFSGTRWQTYQVTTSWMLNDPGARIATLLVYARFRDAKGNVLCGGASLIDDIIYDPLPPTVTLRLTPLAAKQSRLQLQVDDQVGGSGVDAMMLANRSDFLGAVWQPFTDTIILNETQGNTIFVRVRDRAGSSSAITSLPDAKRSAVYLPLMHR